MVILPPALFILISAGFTSASFWEDKGNPFNGIREQLFGNEAPMFIYQESNTRFVGNGEDKPQTASSTLTIDNHQPGPNSNTPIVMPQQRPSPITFFGQPGIHPISSPASKHYFHASPYIRHPIGPIAYTNHPQPAPVPIAAVDRVVDIPFQLPMANPIQLPEIPVTTPPPIITPIFVTSPDQVGDDKALYTASAPLSSASSGLSNRPVIYGPLPTDLAADFCPADFLCCDQGAVYRNHYRLLLCCGNSSFDRRFEQCAGGLVLPLKQGMPQLTPADRLAKLSCGPANEIYLTPPIYQCCNATFYDSTKFRCTDGHSSVTMPTTMPTTMATKKPIRIIALTTRKKPVHSNISKNKPPSVWPLPPGAQPIRRLVQSVPKRQQPQSSSDAISRQAASAVVLLPRRGNYKDEADNEYEYLVCEIYRYKMPYQGLRIWGCCGSNLFNFRMENCTEGKISQNNRLPHIQRPEGELMIYCLGGVQHWINPAHLHKTRCCGSQICPDMISTDSISEGNSGNEEQIADDEEWNKK